MKFSIMQMGWKGPHRLCVEFGAQASPGHRYFGPMFRTYAECVAYLRRVRK